MIYKRIKNGQINSIVLFTTQRNSLHFIVLDFFNTESASFVRRADLNIKNYLHPWESSKRHA